MSRVIVIALTLALGLCACEREQTAQADETAQAPLVAAPAGAVISGPQGPANSALGAPIASRPAPEGAADFDKRPDITTRMNLREIDWDAASAHSALAASSLDADARAALASAVVPVLLPNDPELLAKARVTTGPNWYAVSMDLGDHLVYVQGSRTSFELEQVELDRAGDDLTKRPYLLTRTHQIITMAFERFGAGYGIDIECARPMDDKRCTEDAYARTLWDKLAVVPAEAQP